MKLKSARLVGFGGICRASGLKNIFIDFTKCHHNIIMIMGENGSGKSTIIDALNPFPDPLTKILSNDVGMKELEYILPDGTEYRIHIDYPINQYGDRLQTKAYLYKTVNGFTTNLNPNGNIKSYKDALDNEFNLDANFLSLSQLSVENRGIVDMTPSERKKFVGNGKIISSIEIYNSIYKTLNKRSSIFRSMMNSIVSKIDVIGNEETLIASLVSIDNRIKTLESNKESVNKSLSIAEAKLSMIDPNNELQEKYNTATACVNEWNKSLSQCNIILSNNKFNCDILQANEEVNNEKDCDIIESKLNSLKIIAENELESCRKDLEKIADDKYRTQSSGAEISNKIAAINLSCSSQEIVGKINDIKQKIQSCLDTFKSMKVSPDTALTKDEFITGLNTLKSIKEQVDTLRSFNYESELVKAIEYELNGVNVLRLLDDCETRMESVEKDIEETRNKITYYTELLTRSSILKNRPINCNIDTCEFIKYALEAKSENPEDNLRILSDKQDNLIEKRNTIQSELDSIKVVSSISYNIQIISRYIYNNRVILDKLPNGNIFSDRDKFFDLLIAGSSFDEINNLYSYIQQANVFELYKYYKDMIKSYEVEYELIMNKEERIKSLQDDMDKIHSEFVSLCEKYDSTNMKIDDLNKNLEAIYKYTQQIIKLKEVFNNKIELEKSIKEKEKELEEISSKMKDISDSILIINNSNQLLLNINNELEPIKKERESIQFSLDKLAEYKDELNIYQSKYEKIEIIKKYSSPTKAGIQNLFIEVYMGQTLTLANQLLSKLFNGSLELDKYVINDKEFRIPCRSLDSPIMNDDISSCSTAQKCMISMVLSFALLRQGSSKYNILRLDEIDGTLDYKNRALFLEVIREIMGIMEVENCIMISHSSETVLEDVDIILLNPVDGEIPKGNIIFRYDN